MEKLAVLLSSYKGKEALLLAHHNADPDSVCSAAALYFGLKEIGINAKIGAVDSISRLSKKILDTLNLKVEINPEPLADLIVLLDASTAGQLSGYAETFKNAKTQKVIIDHHAIQEQSLDADLKYIDETSTSSTKLVYELLQKLNISISKEIALLILLGIVAETAHLRFSKLEDLKIITKLLEDHSIKFSEVLSILTLKADISENIARIKCAKRMEMYRIKDYLIVTSNIVSFEASAARALVRLGADLAIVYAKRENELRVSIRSRSTFYEETKIDLAKDIIPEVAKIIDGSGSGHPTAAGANGKAVDKGEKVLKHVVDYVKNKLEHE